MTNGSYVAPSPVNEPVRSYARGTAERKELEQALHVTSNDVREIPVVAGGDRIFSGEIIDVVMPHDHAHVLAKLHRSRREDVEHAIDSALRIAPVWQAMPFEQRAAIFLRAADMLAGPWRARINAACMLGQSKTAHQAEIDAACELIDFFRFNVHFAERIMREQPFSSAGAWNRAEYRALEGFVLAITPFNFLSIAVNLPTAPALLGNVVLWKPATSAALPAWHCFELLHEAGLPEGVVSFIPGEGPAQSAVALDSPHLAGIHFTGSTGTFNTLLRQTAERIDTYRGYPRLVGETGGKDFVLVHPSADVSAAIAAIVRGGYEYQGQKCSAVSRVYIPRTMWPVLRDALVAELETVRVGDVADFSSFMGAVIDERAFDRISNYLEYAGRNAKVVFGGTSDKSIGWFVQPTLVEVDDPKHRLMQEEIFGPVVSVWTFDEQRWDEVLDLIDTTSPYALTGALFARDRPVIAATTERLRNAAGNFYVNDKPTGAVVGQQPFGGARKSGTNDKAGSPWNLIRWMSPRTIKETFVSPLDYRYPFMDKP